MKIFRTILILFGLFGISQYVFAYENHDDKLRKLADFNQAFAGIYIDFKGNTVISMALKNGSSKNEQSSRALKKYNSNSY